MNANTMRPAVMGIFFGVSLIFGAAWSAIGDESTPPSDQIILTVKGKMSKAGRDGAVHFTRGALEALGTARLQTATPWTEGRPLFEGVFGRDVLDAVGATGKLIKATALNDYTVEIPVSDFTKYPVVFALRKDGHYLSRREKGPLWVIYPWDQHTALQTDKQSSKMIWQLKALLIE